MDIELDPVTNDLLISGNDLSLVDGVDAIAQHIQIRLQTFLGEWFLDRRIGIPYFQTIFEKATTQNVIRAIFRQAILTTQGISGLSNLNLDFDGLNRTLGVDFTATTNTGETLVFDRELIIDV